MNSHFPPSILDNDMYKFTMQQFAVANYPDAVAEYQFINRGNDRFNADFVKDLKQQVLEFPKLKLQPSELSWLKSLPWVKHWYPDFLANYVYDPTEVTINLNEDNNLDLKVAGPWHHAILWEVPLLALISANYYTSLDRNWYRDESICQSQLEQKFNTFDKADCSIVEFGTRRRRDFWTQNLVIDLGRQHQSFKGTSNMYLAMQYGLEAKGTQAHELFQAESALNSLLHANRFTLQEWVDFYQGKLGIALTDTYGLEAFFADFNGLLARVYDGLRHDSGSPFIFVDKAIAHYQALGINPLTKIAFFSDNLNVEKVLAIKQYCSGKMPAVFGIGTNLTNDYAYCNSKALNIVIKMYKMNGCHVVKISDEPAKACGDRQAISSALNTFLQQLLDK